SYVYVSYPIYLSMSSIDFFFQAEDGIRDFHVTGVQTCALPILAPWREMALLSASALIMVPNMPIMSAVTRSVPSAAPAMPRKILPPPTTMAISTPLLATSEICLATACRNGGSIPKELSPASASPDTLRRMRSEEHTS